MVPSLRSSALSHTFKRKFFGANRKLLLFMFSSLHFMLYFDRGVFSALLSDVQDDFGLSNLQGGVCSSAFLVCYCLASPVFAQLAKNFRPYLMCAIGVTVWIISVISSGLSLNFASLLVARALTGVGQASFLVIAAPCIDAFAPTSLRSTWLAIFFMAIPIGFAFGAVVAGSIADSMVFGSNWSWRSVYFLEALCTAPLVILFATISGPPTLLYVSTDHHTTRHNSYKMPRASSLAEKQAKKDRTKQVVLELPVQHQAGNELQHSSLGTAHKSVNGSKRGSQATSIVSIGTEFATFRREIVALAKSQLFVLIVFGYAAQTFFFGGVMVFGIDYLRERFDLSKQHASAVFGATTALTGLFGTALGGIVLDKLKPKVPRPPASLKSTAPKPVSQESPVAKPLAVLAKSINEETLDRNHGNPGNPTNATTNTTAENNHHQLALPVDMHSDAHSHSSVASSLFVPVSPQRSSQMISAICEEAAHREITACCLVAAPASLGAFGASTFGLFVALLVVAEMASFMMIGPINSAIVWITPITLQPTALALSNLIAHLLGDALSPVVVGALTDRYGRSTALFCSSFSFVISGVLFFVALLKSRREITVIKTKESLASKRAANKL